MAKKLTQTQIKAICDKLRREVRARDYYTGPTFKSQMDDNRAAVEKEIRGSNLSTAMKKLLLAPWGEHGSYAFDQVVARNHCDRNRNFKALKLPHPTPTHETTEINKIRDKINDMIEDLRFELTMVDAENYQAAMDEFRDKVATAFN